MPRFLDTVPIVKPKRSSFDLSNRYKFTARFANLIPAVCIPTLPSDHFSLAANFQARLAALINPIYDDITARVEWFFVPNELLWSRWKEFITGNSKMNIADYNPNTLADGLIRTVLYRWSDDYTQDFVQAYYDLVTVSGSDSLTNLVDYVGSDWVNGPAKYAFVKNGSLADYLGIGLATYDALISEPQNVDYAAYSFNLLPFLAYQRVYSDYYFNEQTDLLSWETFFAQFNEYIEQNGSSGNIIVPYDFISMNSTASEFLYGLKNRAWNKDIFTTATIKPVGDAAVNIDTSSGSISIPQINLARALYRLGYKDNITGGRYDENILAQFGILPSAVEMHRAVFLGSQSYKVNVNGVVQTSATSDVSPQANMAGLGVASGSTGRINYTCHEHGYIIGMFSIMPRSTYAFSTRKDFFRSDRFDFAWPDLAGIGDEEINIGEVWDVDLKFFNSMPITRDDTFGYQQRYYDYKQILDSVHGGFRNFTGDLGAYTMARTAPIPVNAGSIAGSFKLNPSFVRPDSYNLEMSRPFADSDIYTGGYHYVCDFYADIRANRPIPEYSLPML